MSDHRMPRRWVRAELPPARERWAKRAAEVADWLSVAARNVFAPRRLRPSNVDPFKLGVGGYALCLACRVDYCRRCQTVAEPAPCGCTCVQAAYSRRAANDRQVRAL